MTNPTVCAVMLVNGRPEMVKRAVASFRAQTYENKRLLIYDTSPDSVCDLCDSIGVGMDETDVEIIEAQAKDHHGNLKTIGYLRNRAAIHLGLSADIICHWDSDDWSHPNRIAEQVALLQASGADCVGYTRGVFWHTDKGPSLPDVRTPYFNRPGADIGEAWLYTSPKADICLGASLLYWRKAWEHKPFLDMRRGEDLLWQQGGDIKVFGHMALGQIITTVLEDGSFITGCTEAPEQPRMVYQLNVPTNQLAKADWRRAPEWDDYCRSAMAL